MGQLQHLRRLRPGEHPMNWRKSKRSMANAACVEVTTLTRETTK